MHPFGLLYGSHREPQADFRDRRGQSWLVCSFMTGGDEGVVGYTSGSTSFRCVRPIKADGCGDASDNERAGHQWELTAPWKARATFSRASLARVSAFAFIAPSLRPITLRHSMTCGLAASRRRIHRLALATSFP